MTPKLDLLDGDTLLLSPSQLDEIKTCPRRWLYRYLHRRVPARVNPAANGGKAFDAALNYRYATLGSAACTPEVEAEMLNLIDAGFAGVELPLDEYRTAARYKEVVMAYNEHWKQEPFEVLGVQVPFAVELGQLFVLMGKPKRVVLHGILDLFVRLGEHVMIVDTKTSKSGREGAYENSAQMKAYCWAIPELARVNPGAGLPERVHGCFINEVVIREPYRETTLARLVKNPNARSRPRNEFRRTLPTFYSPERLAEWRLDTLAWVEQALGWVARDHFPQNEKHCTFHYGAKCGYLGVCSLPAEQRAVALGSDEFMNYERGPLGETPVESEPTP